VASDKFFYVVATETVPVRTVNRQCSSGLQAVADVVAAIKAGFYDIGKLFTTVVDTEPGLSHQTE